MPGYRRQPGMIGLGLLAYQIIGNIGIQNIPPATFITMTLQCLLYLRLIRTPWNNVGDICISVQTVLDRKEWTRLIFGAFVHADDWHLYYNMLSFVLKGITLESRMGSGKFLYTLAIFTFLCNTTLLALCHMVGTFMDPFYHYQCSVGFSGVIFALKVLTSQQGGSSQLSFLPIQVPFRYLVWAELLLIQIMVPNASFLGHLAGIIVGLMYLHTPLKHLMDNTWDVLAGFLFAVPANVSFPQGPRFRQDDFYASEGSNIWRNHYPAYADRDYTEFDQGLPYPPQAFQAEEEDFYRAARMEDEEFQRAIDESLRDGIRPTAPPPSMEEEIFQNNNNRIYPDLDEMRRRRIDYQTNRM